jgi:hypothetical protein
MSPRAILFAVLVALGGACNNSGSSSQPTGSPASSACKTNADCPAGKACYFQTGMACGGAGGVCVARLSPTCPQTRGGGCPCLDVASTACPPGQGGAACQGGDVPTACWYCYIPQ